MDQFNGKVLVRMPRDLHARLAQLAEHNDVSLNMYIVSLLSINASRAVFSEGLKEQAVKEELRKIKQENFTGQDSNTGRRGNEVGRFIGQTVADYLNIELKRGSNQGDYKGRNVVIKSARKGNSQFGITNRMAEEIEDVILAKEVREGYFDLFIVEFDKIKDTGRPTASRGSIGRVTNYKVSEVINNGIHFDSMHIDIP